MCVSPVSTSVTHATPLLCADGGMSTPESLLCPPLSTAKGTHQGSQPSPSVHLYCGPHVPTSLETISLQNSGFQEKYNASHICNFKFSNTCFREIKKKQVKLILIIYLVNPVYPKYHDFNI